MKATVEHKITVVLEMDEGTACWLLEVMRNPIGGNSDRTEKESEMRRSCFMALSNALTTWGTTK